jgi:hypothetical protein
MRWLCGCIYTQENNGGCMKKERLFKEDGAPRFIRCYETKRNPTIDRFTVVFTRANAWGGKECKGYGKNYY